MDRVQTAERKAHGFRLVFLDDGYVGLGTFRDSFLFRFLFARIGWIYFQDSGYDERTSCQIFVEVDWSVTTIWRKGAVGVGQSETRLRRIRLHVEYWSQEATTPMVWLESAQGQSDPMMPCPGSWHGV